MISKKGSEYFSFSVQTQEKRNLKAMCFSPKKHKRNIEKRAESGTPSKITKYNPDGKDSNVIWINYNTVVDDADETKVNFSKVVQQTSSSHCLSTQDIESIKVYQTVTVKGYVTFGDNIPQQLAMVANRTKLEGRIIDTKGSIPLTLWNDDIQKVDEGQFYIMENMSVRQYQGQKYLSSTPQSNFQKQTDQLPPLSAHILQEARAELSCTTIHCTRFKSATILTYYNCDACGKRVSTRQESSVLKCTSCNSFTSIEDAPKTTAARVSMVTDEDQVLWFTLFPNMLQIVITQYNSLNQTDHTNIEELTDTTLGTIILAVRNMKLTLRSDQILNISFEGV